MWKLSRVGFSFLPSSKFYQLWQFKFIPQTKGFLSIFSPYPDPVPCSTIVNQLAALLLVALIAIWTTADILYINTYPYCFTALCECERMWSHTGACYTATSTACTVHDALVACTWMYARVRDSTHKEIQQVVNVQRKVQLTDDRRREIVWPSHSKSCPKWI